MPSSRVFHRIQHIICCSLTKISLCKAPLTRVTQNYARRCVNVYRRARCLSFKECNHHHHHQQQLGESHQPQRHHISQTRIKHRFAIQSQSQSTVPDHRNRFRITPGPSTRSPRSFRARHKRAPSRSSQLEMPSKTPHTNGNEAVENGLNGTKDIEMKDDAPASLKGGKGKKPKDGEEEMTVVVPPSKASKLSSAASKDREGDVSMETEEQAAEDDGAVKVDPVTKAVSGTLLYFSHNTYLREGH